MGAHVDPNAPAGGIPLHRGRRVRTNPLFNTVSRRGIILDRCSTTGQFANWWTVQWDNYPELKPPPAPQCVPAHELIALAYPGRARHRGL